MNEKLKSIFDTLIRCHSITRAELNSDNPNMANIENSLDLQGMTLIELKELINGSYYLSDDEKQAYYHEEHKKRLSNELNQQ